MQNQALLWPLCPFADIVRASTPLTRLISGNPWHTKNTNLHLTESRTIVSELSRQLAPLSPGPLLRKSPEYPEKILLMGSRDAGKERDGLISGIS